MLIIIYSPILIGYLLLSQEECKLLGWRQIINEMPTLLLLSGYSLPLGTLGGFFVAYKLPIIVVIQTKMNLHNICYKQKTAIYTG